MTYQFRKKSVLAIVILTFVTCGLYYFYWLFKTSEYLNDLSDEVVINPVMAIILTLITCGLYQFYWFYKANQVILEAKRDLSYSYQNDNYVTYVLLILFSFSWVAILVMQSDLNDLWDRMDEQYLGQNKKETRSRDFSKEDDNQWSDF